MTVAISFQSTPSLRKVTKAEKASGSRVLFQSTPSLRKVTESDGGSDRVHHISIHTFLAEGDDKVIVKAPDTVISIHTFLAEGDGTNAQSILVAGNFNPHLPCGR